MATMPNLQQAIQGHTLVNALANENDPENIKGLLSSYSQPQGTQQGVQRYTDTNVTPLPQITQQMQPLQQAMSQQTTQATQAPTSDSQGNINSMYDSSLNSTLANLKQKIADSISSQNKLITDAPAQFTDAKNQTQNDQFQSSQNLKEMLANNGLSDSGYGLQSQLGINNTASKNLNTVNLAQQKIISDANAQIAQLTADGNLQEAQAVSDNATARLQALIGQQNTDTARQDTLTQNGIQNAMNEANLTGTYNGVQTLQAKQADLQNQQNAIANAMQEAQLTGNYKGQQTLAAQAQALQAQQDQISQALNIAQVTGMYNGQETQSAKQNDIANQLNQQQLQAQITQNNTSNSFNQQQFAYQKSQDQAAQQAATQKQLLLDKANATDAYTSIGKVVNALSAKGTIVNAGGGKYTAAAKAAILNQINYLFEKGKLTQDYYNEIAAHYGL